jgi:tRNA threonylcarbamoyladenosine biosynthesis protein TsaB
VMAAKALAYAVKCDFLAVETFAVIACQCPPDAPALDVISDGQRGMLYTQRFARPDATEWTPATELQVVAKEEWLGDLGSDVLVSGPGLALVDADLPTGARAAPAELRDADLRGLLLAGLARYERGERDDPWRCEPLYLRRSSAEENWDRKHPKA